MTPRCSTPADAAARFRTFADAEGDAVPMYARLCRVIASDEDLAGLLLLAPANQRLPVLVLNAVHDVVLRDPSCPIAHWFPNVTGHPPPGRDPADALRATVEEYREEIEEIITTRRIQTNEVNRCAGWRLALGRVCAGDDRPLALIELGPSAGLNLRLDDYRIETTDARGTVVDIWGTPESTVRVTSAMSDPSGGPELDPAGPGAALLATDIPPVRWRVGLDERPVDVTDPDDARWLKACVWPEQLERFERLSAALERAASDPPTLRVGEFTRDLRPLLDEAPHGHHVVVVSSWALAYVQRDERNRVIDQMRDAAALIEGNGGRMSLLTLEPESSLDWVPEAELAADEPASRRHASILAATMVGTAGVDAVALARCQAHVVWAEMLPDRT